MKRNGLDTSGLVHGQMMGVCEHDNENLGSIYGHVIYWITGRRTDFCRRNLLQGGRRTVEGELRSAAGLRTDLEMKTCRYKQRSLWLHFPNPWSLKTQCMGMSVFSVCWRNRECSVKYTFICNDVVSHWNAYCGWDLFALFKMNPSQ